MAAQSTSDFLQLMATCSHGQLKIQMFFYWSSGDNTFHQLGYFSKNVVQKPMRVEWFVKNNIVVQYEVGETLN